MDDTRHDRSDGMTRPDRKTPICQMQLRGEHGLYTEKYYLVVRGKPSRQATYGRPVPSPSETVSLETAGC